MTFFIKKKESLDCNNLIKKPWIGISLVKLYMV